MNVVCQISRNVRILEILLYTSVYSLSGLKKKIPQFQLGDPQIRYFKI
jgi:hypothetical protein